MPATITVVLALEPPGEGEGNCLHSFWVWILVCQPRSECHDLFANGFAAPRWQAASVSLNCITLGPSTSLVSRRSSASQNILHQPPNLCLPLSPDSCVVSLMWSIVEVGTAILCASVPSIKPLISKLLPGRIFSTQGRRTAGRVSAISGPYDLKHLSGIVSSVGLDSRHSRMSLNKTTMMTRIYSPAPRSDGNRSLESDDPEIGVALSTTEHSPPPKKVEPIE